MLFRSNISSTKIRTAISLGNIEEANRYLGYSYMIGGVVVPGDRIGRGMGFPTANIRIASDKKLLPAVGVYAVFVELSGKIYKGNVLIKEMAEIGRREKVDGIVAIGGGSCMDAAKCVKLLLDNDEALENFYDVEHPQKSVILMIAIPTTAGSGSEASKGAVVTDTQNGIKCVVIGAGTTPALSLIDPELTTGLPPKITAACAFDVLAHAIDAINTVIK